MAFCRSDGNKKCVELTNARVVTPAFLNDSSGKGLTMRMNQLKTKNPRRTSSPVTKAGRRKDDKAMPRIKTIVVPTDFSTESLKAIEHASALAKEFGAALWLVHVVERPPVLPESPVVAALLTGIGFSVS